MEATASKYTTNQVELARYANALAHPVRVAILDLLASQTYCYHGDMAEELPIARSTLSQHLNVLKDSGLIQGEIFPPKTKYCINREIYKLAAGLFSTFFKIPPDTECREEGDFLC